MDNDFTPRCFIRTFADLIKGANEETRDFYENRGSSLDLHGPTVI